MGYDSDGMIAMRRQNEYVSVFRTFLVIGRVGRGFLLRLINQQKEA
jgi:hypothetical protein